MHGSWGNTITADDAFQLMGADVMRWQYCAQPPDRNLLFGFRAADQIKRELLTLWNSVSFFVLYANIEGFRPSWSSLEPSGELRPLDRWLVERTHAFVADATRGYESWLAVDVIRDYQAYVDDLSNWYIRRTRSRFWEGDAAALGHALVRVGADVARARAGAAVSHGASVAESRAGRAGVGASRAVAGCR